MGEKERDRGDLEDRAREGPLSRGKIHRRWWALSASAGLAVAAYLLFQFWDTPVAALQTGKAAEAYRRAGWPWEAKDLAPVPPVSESENAAPVLRRAAAVLPRADDPRPAINWAQPASLDVARLADALAPFKTALDFAHQAAARPRLDFHWDWDEGPALVTPEMAPFRKIIRALVARAELHAVLQAPVKCATDLDDALNLAELCETEPDWFCLGFGLNSQQSVLGAVTVAAFCARNDPTALDRLKQIVNRIRIPRSEGALRGVVYHNLALLRNYEAFGPGLDNSEAAISLDHSRIQRTGLPSGLTARAYATRFFQAWAEAKNLMDANEGDPAKYWPAINRIGNAAYNHRGSSYRLMAILVPIMADTKKLHELPASIAVTGALLEVLKFKTRRGSWPASLANLPRKWTDPFSGGPLHYLVRGDSVRIYSLGPDGVDHGGRTRSETTDTARGYNVAAVCPPIPPRAAR